MDEKMEEPQQPMQRKLRSQTSNSTWTNEKQRWEESEKKVRREGQTREEKRRLKKSKLEKVRRKKMQMREKVGKPRNTVFFQWFVAPEGRKVSALKH